MTSSYFLTDNFNLTDPQSHIPTKATPIIEKSISAEIVPPAAVNKIDSFVTSNVENNIDSAYKKIKDILLWNIRNDVSGFIQNEIKD